MKKTLTALIYNNESVGERKMLWDIRLRTSKLCASNHEVLLDTGSNTVFDCQFGWTACDGSGKDATVSIVARI